MNSTLSLSITNLARPSI